MILQLNSTYYGYCGVDPAAVEKLLSAESMGRYYNTDIKSSATNGRYDCRGR